MREAVDVERYESALREHLRLDADEHVLLHAYELGRHLMEQGLGLLDVVRVHAAAIVEIEREEGDSSVHGRAEGFLAEVLAPFEMAYLGFKEANESLSRLTASLEEQVAERTRELQASLSVLQTTQAERQRLLARIVAAEEQERHRIADDVHDDTIQAVTAVSLRLASLRRRLQASDLPVLDRVQDTVGDAIARLRRLSFELRPPALDRQGLAAALRDLLEMSKEEDGPAWLLHDGLEREPPVELAEVAYRLAQEALSNIRKHAEASHVDVVLDQDERGLQLVIVDDGRGFDTRVLRDPRPGHFGTSAMRERAALVDGRCTIESMPGQGTTVTVSLPLPTAAG